MVNKDFLHLLVGFHSPFLLNACRIDLLRSRKETISKQWHFPLSQHTFMPWCNRSNCGQLSELQHFATGNGNVTMYLIHLWFASDAAGLVSVFVGVPRQEASPCKLVVRSNWLVTMTGRNCSQLDRNITDCTLSLKEIQEYVRFFFTCNTYAVPLKKLHGPRQKDQIRLHLSKKTKPSSTVVVWFSLRQMKLTSGCVFPKIFKIKIYCTSRFLLILCNMTQFVYHISHYKGI